MPIQRLLDDPLRERLVAEASLHVLRFDRNDVARRTAAVCAELGGEDADVAAASLRPA
jgi:hypothetical protein